MKARNGEGGAVAVESMAEGRGSMGEEECVSVHERMKMEQRTAAL